MNHFQNPLLIMHIYFISPSSSSPVHELIQITTNIQGSLLSDNDLHAIFYFEDQSTASFIKQEIESLKKRTEKSSRILSYEISKNELDNKIKAAIEEETSSLFSLFYFFHEVDHLFSAQVPFVFHIYETDGFLRNFFNTVGRAWIPQCVVLIFNNEQSSLIYGEATPSPFYKDDIDQFFKLLKHLQPNDSLNAINALQQFQLKLVQDYSSKCFFLANQRLFFDTVAICYPMQYFLIEPQQFLAHLFNLSSLYRYAYIFFQLNSFQPEVLSKFFDDCAKMPHFLPSNVCIYSAEAPLELRVYGSGSIDYTSFCYTMNQQGMPDVFQPPIPHFLTYELSKKSGEIIFNTLVNAMRVQQPSVVTNNSEATLNRMEVLPPKKKRKMRHNAESSSIYFDLKDVQKRNAWAQEHNFEYSTTKAPELSAYEQKLIVGQVSVLGSHAKVWGIFNSQEAIPAGIRIGRYVGEKVKLNTLDNRDYTFLLDEKEKLGLDARKVRNWTGVVNSTSALATANVVAFMDENQNIYYSTTKLIKPFEQLLAYYGEQFDYDSSSASFRFLKPTDNWKSSCDIMAEYPIEYTGERKYLPEKLRLVLGMSAQQCFAVPNIVSEKSINLPILALNENHQPLEQYQQENLTLLMKACWEGDEKLVSELLENSACVDTQSSIHGYTALDLAILSEQSLEVKQAIISLLLSHGALLHLQNTQGKSSLFHAIDQREIVLIHQLLNKEKEQEKLEEELLMNGINHNDEDPFIYALDQHFYEAFDILLTYISASDIQSYIKNATLNLASDNNVRNEQLHKLQQVIQKENAFSEEKKKNLVHNLEGYVRISPSPSNYRGAIFSRSTSINNKSPDNHQTPLNHKN